MLKEANTKTENPRHAETKDLGRKLGRNALDAFREWRFIVSSRFLPISFGHFKAAAEHK